MDKQQVSDEAIFSVGKVMSVKGRTVAIKVDKTKNASHLLYKGELLRNTAVGGYLKIAKGFTRIIGKVEGEEITEDKVYDTKSGYASGREKVDRVLTVSLLGFFKGDQFERGIKELPLIDNECYLLQNSEFEQVHNFIRSGDEPLTIGTLSFEKGQDIRVGVNSLFASHIAIFGNTGSGKSYTLAKVYRELFLRYKDQQNFRRRARFFLLDFNGEYVADEDAAADDVIIDEQYKNVFRLSTHSIGGGDKFPISTEAIEDVEFWAVFLEATEKTQRPFLLRAIENTYTAPRVTEVNGFRQLISQTLREAMLHVDKNVDRGAAINFLRELNRAVGENESLQQLIADYEEHLIFHSQQMKYLYRGEGQPIYSDNQQFVPQVIDAKVANINIDPNQFSPIDRIGLQIIFQYYGDIIRGFSNKEHIAPLVKRLDKRIDYIRKVIEVRDEDVWEEKNITVVSLKDVNMQMRKVLPLLFCKRLYNDKKADDDSSAYLNIIIDEAHNILSEQSERESEQWKDYRLETFEEMIKEGRKFGVFLTIASQRPADISPTIISQMHNYFLHRLINNEDIHAIRQTISYLDKVSFEYMPLLPTGTCVLAGLLANVPIVVDIGEIQPKKHEPKNKTMTLTDKWQ